MRATLQDQGDRCVSIARQRLWIASVFKFCVALFAAGLSLWLFTTLVNDRFVDPEDPKLRAAQELGGAIVGLVAWASLGTAIVLGRGALRRRTGPRERARDRAERARPDHGDTSRGAASP